MPIMENTASVDRRSQSKFLALVFGYMFLGLLVTALVSFGAGYGFSLLIVNNPTAYAVTLYTVMVVGFIALFITQIVMSLTMFKQKKGAWIPYLLYCAIMGVFLSTFVMFIDFWTIGEAFGITALIFLAMFCIGYFTKVNLSPLAFVGMSLLVGCLLVSGLFGIIFLVTNTWQMMDFVVSIILVVAITLIVGFDANRMRRETENGYLTNNLALYYAYSFYTDFIGIFIRVLYLLALSKSNN